MPPFIKQGIFNIPLVDIDDLQERFQDLLARIYDMMNDETENIIIQSHFDNGTAAQKIAILEIIKTNVLQLSLGTYSRLVVTKALETVSPEKKLELATKLSGHVLTCSTNKNGHFVIRTCIEQLDSNLINFIHEPIRESVKFLSVHKYGHHVIGSILRFCGPEYTTPILDNIYNHLHEIIKDEFGILVIQYSLLNGTPEYKYLVFNYLRSKLLELCRNKYSSDIVIHCLVHAIEETRILFLEEVCGFNDDQMQIMMTDTYAHHVLRVLICTTEKEQSKMLISKIEPHISFLKNSNNGKCLVKNLYTRKIIAGKQICGSFLTISTIK